MSDDHKPTGTPAEHTVAELAARDSVNLSNKIRAVVSRERTDLALPMVIAEVGVSLVHMMARLIHAVDNLYEPLSELAHNIGQANRNGWGG